jgi:anti-sigma B factor antagonist
MPSPQPRQVLVIEDIRVRERPVTVVRFLVDRLLETDEIEHVGDLLYGLVEEHGRKDLLLNFGNVELVGSYLLGKLLGLQRRIKKANGRLALCQIGPNINPIVYEAFDICGLTKCFPIYVEEQEALQSF